MTLLKNILPKIYNPEVFNHSLKRRKYFENWYFSTISQDRKSMISIVPALSLIKNEKHCYIQVLNGINGETYRFPIPLSDYRSNGKIMDCKYGNTRFHKKGISIDLKNDTHKISGELEFENLNNFPSTLFKPGIMGFYSFIPFLKTYYNVISISHKTKGSIRIDNQEFNFTEGSSFIEKAWGRLYPKTWFWINCHIFNEPQTSLLIIASPTKIAGIKFLGILGYLRYKDEIFNFSIYKGGKMTHFERDGKSFNIEFKCKSYKLDITVIPKIFGEINIPSETNDKERNIYISSNATLHVDFYHEEKLLAKLEGLHSSFDLVDDIINYFR